MLTVGSLFSGIGGFELGLERAGMQIEWQVEIDDFARRILERHWPDVQRFDDVRTIGPGLRPVDVLCGGFPCQDISSIGKGAGLSGARSGLWREMVRTIRLVGPRYVIVENVAALLVRGMGTVLGDLAEIGHDAEWDCIPAASVGAPHPRDRVWLVAHSQGFGRRAVFTESRLLQAPGEGGARPAGASGPEHAADPSRFLWTAEPDVVRVADGIPDRVDRIRGLGNAVVPELPRRIGLAIKAHAQIT